MKLIKSLACYTLIFLAMFFFISVAAGSLEAELDIIQSTCPY